MDASTYSRIYSIKIIAASRGVLGDSSALLSIRTYKETISGRLSDSNSYTLR